MKLLLSILTIIILFTATHAQGAQRDYSRAVIHHTASPEWTTVADVDRWHKENGWDGIGYHYLIYIDGSVHEGRQYKKTGAHAKGRNHYTGIALVGYDDFTPAQIDGLKKLLIILGVNHVEGHHDLCPGPGINLDELIK